MRIRPRQSFAPPVRDPSLAACHPCDLVTPNTAPHDRPIRPSSLGADHSSAKAQGGLGVGLTIIKNLVEMHGGTAEARSEGLGMGREFVVRLPLLPQESVGRMGDESGQRQGLVETSGHRLMAVDVNKDAALIFFDIGMPIRNGLEVANRIRRTPGLERTVLVAVAGRGQQEDRRRTSEAGFDHHLVKPPAPPAGPADLPDGKGARG